MKNISSIFKEIFNSKEFSDLNLLCFTDDHLQNLVDNNVSSNYDQMISDTSVLFYEFLNVHRKKEKNNLSKCVHTKNVQTIIDELKEMTRKLEGLIRSQVDKKSETYLQLFPEGLSEYCRMNRTNVASLMNRVLFFLKTNDKIVTPEIFSKLKNLYDEYTIKREGQIAKKKEYEEIKDENHKLRIELAQQLQRNLYTLAIEYLGEIRKADTFYNQKLLSSKRLKSFDHYKKTKASETQQN